MYGGEMKVMVIERNESICVMWTYETRAGRVFVGINED